MKLVNRSHVRTKILAPVVRFAVDFTGAHDVVDIIVVAPFDSDFDGFTAACERRHLVAVQLRPGSMYPTEYKHPHRRSAPRYELRNWTEHVVATVAHECFHALEFHADKRRCSEVLAERTAVRALRAWRRRHDRHNR